MLSAPAKIKLSGFSLIELMIGIAIMALLLGLAMPSFRTWLQNTQIRNAAESIMNGLQRARAEAVARNANVEFVLGANSSWTTSVAGGAAIESRASSDGSVDVTRTVVPADATTITYNNFGLIVANADGSETLTQVELDSSQLAAADSQELRVVIVTPGGNVRMCDPNAVAPSLRAC